MYQVDATARAPEGLTLNNPAQARKGAVWGHATRVLACMPEARALNPSVFEEFKSASLRDAVVHILAYPTLRFKRDCFLRSRTRTIVGLLPSVAHPHYRGVAPFGRDPRLCGVIESKCLRHWLQTSYIPM